MGLSKGGGGGIRDPTSQILGKPSDPELSHPHRGGGGAVEQPPTQSATKAVHKTRALDEFSASPAQGMARLAWHGMVWYGLVPYHLCCHFASHYSKIGKTVGEKETLTKPTHPP